jgi:hypothetical protein
MKKALIFLACCLCIAAIAAALGASEIKVPGDYPTIQDAIDASSWNDEILVAPGTYNENIDFNGKNVWVKSTHGPSVTVIKGDQSDSVVIFQSGETSDAVLEGFTVTNGIGHYISSIPAREEGGGILCLDSDPVILHNVITGNYAEFGGGVSLNGGNALVFGNLIEENGAEGGGGIWIIGGEGVVDSNLITGNGASRGGAVYGHQSEPLIVNNMIWSNTATETGGAFRFFNSCNPTVVNNTVVANHAQNSGGGIYMALDSQAEVVNTILWKNSAPLGPEGHVDGMMGPVSMNISYCDVQYGFPSFQVTSPGTLNWGAGMIEDDPLFAEEAAFDYHLPHDSPCRNAGNNAAVVYIEDFEGDPRTVDSVVDLGADEFHPHLYNTGNATPGGLVKGKLVGWPGSSPVGLWFSAGVLEDPLPSAFGPWYLTSPFIGPVIVLPIPASGIEVIPATLPATPPGPYSIAMQAYIGGAFTNVSLLIVE